METKTLTQAQFTAVNDAIDNLVRGVRKGTAEEKVAAQAVSAEWEKAIALPVRTADQRAVRLSAIAAVAVKHNLI